MEVPMSELTEELLEFVDDVVDELGSRKEVERIRQIVKDGTGAERQIAAYRRTGDLRAVMDYVVRETEEGLGVT
jgi:carboxylate-amine ligase